VRDRQTDTETEINIFGVRERQIQKHRQRRSRKAEYSNIQKHRQRKRNTEGPIVCEIERQRERGEGEKEREEKRERERDKQVHRTGILTLIIKCQLYLFLMCLIIIRGREICRKTLKFVLKLFKLFCLLIYGSTCFNSFTSKLPT